MAPNKKNETQQIEVNEIETQDTSFCIVGTSPMIQHRFSQKAWRELLLPSLKENRASLEQKLKHDPMAEYRGAFYRNRDHDSPALFHIPNGSFHGALGSAALDLPGAKRAQIERLTRISDVNIELFGIPQIFCAMVRNSDIGRTPDVRTRPIFPRWACKVTVRYVRNIVTQRTIANLMGAAGVIIGIGDWRGERGGPYGAFRLVSADDREFKEICGKMGRVPQQKAYENPAYYDDDTQDIMLWFETEVKRREMEGHLKKGDDLESSGGLRTIMERGKKDGEYLGMEDDNGGSEAARAGKGRTGNGAAVTSRKTVASARGRGRAGGTTPAAS